MKYKLVSVKDTAVQAFQAIGQVRTPGEANRAFRDLINNADNKQMNQHPEDFELYVIGEWDDQTGQVTPQDPELLARGKDVSEKIQ